MSLTDMLQKTATDAAAEVVDSAACGETPPVLTESAMRRFAERCGQQKALSLISSELGVDPKTLLDASTGAIDWKRAASEALNLEGLTGIAGMNEWFSPGGDFNYDKVAMSVGAAAGTAACVAAGAATAGVTAALSPVCGAIGGGLASWVVDGISGWFKEEDLFAPGRYIAWHVSPIGMMSMAAQYFSRDGLGPTFESYAFSNPGDFVSYAADLRNRTEATPLSVYYLARQTVLEVCASIDVAISMWEKGTGQSLALVAQKEGKSPWRYVFDEFQKNKMGFAEGMFCLLAHEPGVLEVVDMGNGFTNAGIQMHDLASFAKDRGQSLDVKRYIDNPALLSLDNAFKLTRYDDPVWQAQNGVSVENKAPGDFLLQFSQGYADYYTEMGAVVLSGVANPTNPFFATGAPTTPAYPVEEYTRPTEMWNGVTWLYSIGPFETVEVADPEHNYHPDYSIRPAALQRVTTQTVFSYDEQRVMSERIPDTAQLVLEYPTATNLTPDAKVYGAYFFLPGTYWSRHLLFVPGPLNPGGWGTMPPEQWPADSAISANQMVRAWTVGTKLPWDMDKTFTFTPVWDGEIVSYGPTVAALDGQHDNLWVKVNKFVWRNALQHPESILAWSGGLRARLDRALGILRQYIRRWRRDNLGADGLPKPGAAVLSLGEAMKQTAPMFDKLADLEKKGSNILKEVAKVSGKSPFANLPRPKPSQEGGADGGAEEPTKAVQKPSAGKVALVGVGAAALVAGAWFAYKKLWRR